MKKWLLVALVFFLASCSTILWVEPEMTIRGVREGEMYAKAPTLSVNEKRGKVTATVNGRVVSLPYTPKNNGQYEAVFTSRFLFREAKESVRFEVDDTPPHTPILVNGVEDIYFKEAFFDLKEEEDVTYEATLNEKPFNLKTPITEDGQYELHINAKKRNGLTSQRTLSFEVDSRTYTKKEVDTFLDFYFDEGSGAPWLAKWTDDVTVVVEGKRTSEDEMNLKTYVENLNELLPIELRLSESKQKETRVLTIHYLPTAQFKTKGYTNPIYNQYSKTVGITMPTIVTFDKGITEMTVLIGTDTKQENRNVTVLHELMHALGLLNHFEHDRSSILFPYSNESGQVLNQNDKRMVELLYRSDVEIGDTREDIENTIRVRTN